MKFKIAVDAMGGDFAPHKIVEGAVLAAQYKQVEIILVGKENLIKNELSKYPETEHLSISIQHASEVIEMEDSPSQASKTKKDASIVVATKLVAQGKADAVVSAGNSGAVMTSALRYLGRIEGIYRPAIATLIPTLKNNNSHCIVCDVGANSDCKPEYLLQFAIMSKILANTLLHIKNPKIGLLSIGEEKEKGNHLTKETSPLLESCQEINFIGNVEGRDIPKGKADVVVCDGFVGNVLLKTMEGTADCISKMIKTEITNSLQAKIGYLFMKSAFKNFRKRMDSSEYGGAPLLGVKGVCIISHGKSTAKAIKNAIKVAEQIVAKKVNQEIHDEIQRTFRNDFIVSDSMTLESPEKNIINF